MLWGGQQQACINYIHYEWRNHVGTFRAIWETDFIQQPGDFICVLNNINDGKGAGLISKQNLGTFMLMRKYMIYDYLTKTYYDGRVTEDDLEEKTFKTRIVPDSGKLKWHLMLFKKFEPWEEEFHLRLLRLHGSGIPDFFMTNKPLLADNPNPNSLQVKVGDRERSVKLIHLKMPFELFVTAVIFCMWTILIEGVFTELRIASITRKFKNTSSTGWFFKSVICKLHFTPRCKTYTIAYIFENQFVDNFINFIWWGQIFVLQQILMEMETLFRKVFFYGFWNLYP